MFENWFSKEVKKVGKKIVDPSVKEFEEIGKGFNHLTDNFLKRLLTEKWKDVSGVKVKSIMEKATIIKKNSSIKLVINKLKKTEDTLIVVDDKSKLLGTIEESDIIQLLVPQDRVTDLIGVMGSYYNKTYFAKKAEEIMKKNIYFVTPETAIEKAAYLMYKNKLITIPVIKKDKIVGVVHQRDLINKIKR
ncbi:CBS domain-containing protein [archaeon]|jgi:predicted transcriptional regulator|nr:CBS domain-containing protein [archaeon]MBT3731005.1 CBS domain-containing protein [archaeon]MBT4669757.1 CBS domain-containing protein [archaeon]MBT5029907.1 CBS domain-containing protein [archaeon]MBT5288479.1 CBS domain-containing protein [archaeon]